MQPLNASLPGRALTEFKYWPFVYLFCAISMAMVVFSEGLSYMLLDWQREEFSHGFMIPLISIFLVLQKLPELKTKIFNYAYSGILVIGLGLIGFFLGELSALYTIIQYSFILVLFGIFISLMGINGTYCIAIPLLYLVFMIPLPNFLYFNLSSHLQLLSSFLGVSILRLLDVSVYLEGNVIDLGAYKLQVVDACSGLRYLFPLMSFGFLVAYIYKNSFFTRATIFLSTIPITILMNSFRITIIGITVDIWGIGAAEGFLHDFQGWAVFMACLALLTLEILIIHRLSGLKGRALDSISLQLPNPIFSLDYFGSQKRIGFATIIALLILAMAIPLKISLNKRSEAVPVRAEFSRVPLQIGNWRGNEGHFDQDVIDALKLKDYMVADYVNQTTHKPINLYMAYYESQRKGASIHSPQTCLPGGGWEIKKIEQITLPTIASYPGKELRVNRVITQKGDTKNLVYYWFQQRGRIVTNELEAKWFIFLDSLTRNRTDGALVRVIIPLHQEDDVVAVEKELQNFVATIAPLLPEYIPE